jgi:hypothetical protein
VYLSSGDTAQQDEGKRIIENRSETCLRAQDPFALAILWQDEGLAHASEGGNVVEGSQKIPYKRAFVSVALSQKCYAAAPWKPI